MEAFVSGYNFDAAVRSSMQLPESICIFDTTLRDGEQTPGVSFTNPEKAHIAEELNELGVHVIEAGFPINSEPEKEVIRQISGMGLRSKVCGLARAMDADIDACIEADVDVIHTFISTSDIHIQHQMNTTREAVKKRAVESVTRIKDNGFECLFSPMDATRTDMAYLIEVCQAVEECGADRINIPDTVGVMNPAGMKYLIAQVRKSVRVPLDVHCHNDFGLAVANSLAGVEAGASGVQVTVNGLGERAGNASLEQAVMALEVLYGMKTGIRTALLTRTSKLVERLSMIHLPPNTPLVGRNAFTHESGIHAAAILKNGMTFEPITPEMVGQRSRIVLGKHTGKHAVNDALCSCGYALDEAQLQEITARIKEISEKQKRISEDEVIALADAVTGSSPSVSQRIKLEKFEVTMGTQTQPRATVVMSVDGRKVSSSAVGVGSVDAAAKAILSAVPIGITLTEYNLKGITGGSDALASVLIRVMDDSKNEYQAEAVHEDIVMASVAALIRCMNKAVGQQKKGVAHG